MLLRIRESGRRALPGMLRAFGVANDGSTKETERESMLQLKEIMFSGPTALAAESMMDGAPEWIKPRDEKW